jgi:capsular exopolysaccharide synthesis family protein
MSTALIQDPATPPIAIVERAIDPRVVLFHAPSAREAEQFRGLRNSILAMNPDRGHRSVLLTSATNGEGTTLSVVNLGLALGELAGTRVLLIDANFRQPRIDQILSLAKDAPGLSDVLADKLPLSRAIRPTIAKSVDALTAGSAVSNPAELLARGRLKALLDALKPSYSYLLLDTPPASEYTDASLTSKDCDGVIFVIRIDAAPRAVVEQAVTQLRTLGANLLGAFVVGAPPTGKPAPIDSLPAMGLTAKKA